MKSALLCCFLVFTSILLAQKPFINSFTPIAGYAGSQTTINGSNFSPSITGNTVFFGAVKATVTAASPTSLTVIVPTGATYQPISVTTNGLTGYSSAPYILTFPGGGTLQQKSFETKKDFTVDLHPNDVAIADFDGDGKPDAATPNNFSTAGQPASVSVLRNTGSTGSVSFAPTINLATGVSTYAIAAGDLNGDGKPDLVSSSLADQTISVFQNTSNTGAISFAPKTDYATNSSPYSIVIGDIDGDGRPDLAVTNYMSNLLSIYRNTSSGNTVSFAPKVDFATGIFPRTAAIGDIDGDSKPDIAVTNQSDNTVSVFQNISSPGSIAFAARQNFTTGSAPYGVAIGDLNNDNKPDLAVSNNGGYFSVLRNTSLTGIISFATKADFFASYSPYQISISDMNGDAKPDVIVSGANLLVSENTSNGSTLSFSSAAYLFLSPTSYATGIADFDGDGKNDIAGAVFTSDKVSFLRNRNNEPDITSYYPNPARTGDTVTITGSNFIGISSVTFGGTNATYFTVVNSTTIKAVVGNGSSGDIVITGQYGTGNSTYNTFTFAGPPVINSFTPTSAGLGQTVTITGRNFTNVSGVSFGGVAAGSYTVTSPTEIKAIVNTGATGKVKITTSYGADSLAGFTFLPLPTVTSFSPSYGGPGMAITVTGTNFTNVTAVSFGGTPARSFTVNSATSITAIVDTGSTGSIAVTTIYGSASRTGFTFYPAPTITSFSPVGGSIGTVVTINGSNFVNNMSVSVGGVSYSGNFILLSPTQIRLTISSTTSADSANIVVTNLGGTAVASGFLFNPQPFFYTISPTEAAQGMKVNITGKHFISTTAVTIGGVAVQSFTVDSATGITAIVGAGATGNVAITNSFGTGSSLNPPFAYNPAPIITSFAPATGTAGTRVIINGGNFGTTPAANIVLFGTIKANVESATANTLIVVVPQGAENDVISVTTNNQTIHTAQPFLPSFTSSSTPLSVASFARSVSFRDGSRINMLKIADIDGDGKPDIVAGRIDTLSIYRNTTSNGILSFAPRVDIAVPNTVQAFGIGDLTSDGKPEIVIATSNISNGRILKNNSTPGNIIFTLLTTFNTNFEYPSAVFIADLDKDAKPDVAINYTGYSAITIYRNTSSGGNFSMTLGTRQGYGNSSSAAYSYFTALADVDNNGKRDFIVSNDLGSFFPIIFNNSILTATDFYFLSLQTRVYDYFSGYNFGCISTADFDQDGKQDILFIGGVLRSTGNMNFSYTSTASGNSVSKIVNADLDGDGKPDYVQTLQGQQQIRASRNTSVSNAISFDAATIFSVEKTPKDLTVSDLDGDGKPDILYCGDQDTAFYILKNITGSSQACVGGNTVFTAGISGTNYQWQVNTGNGFVNISDNGNYSGTNMPDLRLSGISAAWAGYQYRCVVGSSNSAIYTINFLNSWTGQVNNQWENPANWSCGVLPDGNTDVVINGGSVNINSNVQVRSIKVTPQASVTVGTGYSLTVTH